MVERGRAASQSRRPRVIVLDRNGGLARSALMRDGHLHVIDVRSFAEADSTAHETRPHVFVASFDEPRQNEVAELKLLLHRHSGLRALVVSRPITERRVTDLLKAGASGLLFSSDTPLLPNAVRDLLRGGVPMSGPVSRLVLDRARRSSAKMAAVNPQSPAVQALLTPRQREILELLAKGLSYEDVGTALGLSLNTVRTHVRTLYERLGATTKVEAAMVGMEIGLLKKLPPR